MGRVGMERDNQMLSGVDASHKQLSGGRGTGKVRKGRWLGVGMEKEGMEKDGAGGKGRGKRSAGAC